MRQSKALRQTVLQCAVLGLVLPLGLSGCETTKTTGPASSPAAIVRASQPVDAWVLRAGGRTVGALVRFEEAAGGRFLYSVRDGYGFDRGIVDAEGRAWRFIPHSEPEWKSTGTVLAGAGAILELPKEPTMQAVDLEALPQILEASAKR